LTALIIGENSCNSRVNDYFTHKGFTVASIPDVYKLRSVTGEVGNFRVDSKEDTGIEDVHYTEIDFIVLTEQPSAGPVEISGLMTRSLYEAGKTKAASKTAILEPKVFLLDYACESPLAATISALSDAAELARNKRQVFYLAKFIRTAGRGIEALYNEARNAGVTFIKYEDIDIRADLSEEEYSISVSDGVQELEIKTKTVYADGDLDVGERFIYAVKKLNLTANEHGYLTEDKYYLSPVLTSRRGVYHITRDLAAERLDEGLEFIYAHAKSGIYYAPSYGVAIIDGKKCVFCYNCYRACTHAALTPDTESNQMQCLKEACAGCGTCAGLCPANAITLEKDVVGVDDDTENIKSVAKDTANASCKSLVLYCENSGCATLGDISAIPEVNFTGIETQSVPCGGQIDLERLSEGLETYDRALAIVCPDDACRHFDGCKRACAQVKRLQDMLSAAGLDAKKVQVIQVSQAMPGVLKEELQEFLGGK